MQASPSPPPQRSPPRQPEQAEGGVTVDHPPLEPMQQHGGATDWSEDPPAPPPPPPPHSTATIFSKAAQYIPRSSTSHTSDPGRSDGWYSWNGRTKDRRTRPAQPSSWSQPPPPPPRAQPQPKPKPPPRTPAPHVPLPRVAFASPPASPPVAAPPPSAPARSVERDQHRVVPDILSRKRRAASMRRTALVARSAAAGLCLAALAVLAADHRKGWALDSYSNYRQFQYSEAVNIIGFLYSVFQFFALADQLRRNKQLIPRPRADCFDFIMDQVLAYLLISSSSSATARVGDWIDNWGSDPFPKMANSSITISFLAFVVFAVSSLISAYNLFRRDL